MVALSTSRDLTGLLKAWGSGRAGALEELTPMVYDELRRIARRHLRHRPSQTLETTALAHEAYLRLAGAQGLPWQDRVHFFAVASQIMRRILVDAARARAAAKRQDGALRITFSEDLPIAGAREAAVVALDDALTALARFDMRKARVVELRYFGGLSVAEAAEVLKVSEETVMRDWRLAKPWLARELGRGERHGA
ncbi:MAG: sigma-70 family RNA polymerase sigma factor [Acidobacteria bacterium]|nr:sigma-70 family RNA polymerase sigma factor [Acidobacteriota bacterium]